MQHADAVGGGGAVEFLGAGFQFGYFVLPGLDGLAGGVHGGLQGAELHHIKVLAVAEGFEVAVNGAELEGGEGFLGGVQVVFRPGQPLAGGSEPGVVVDIKIPQGVARLVQLLLRSGDVVPYFGKVLLVVGQEVVPRVLGGVQGHAGVLSGLQGGGEAFALPVGEVGEGFLGAVQGGFGVGDGLAGGAQVDVVAELEIVQRVLGVFQVEAGLGAGAFGLGQGAFGLG